MIHDVNQQEARSAFSPSIGFDESQGLFSLYKDTRRRTAHARNADGGFPYRARKFRENSGSEENPHATAISRMLIVE